MKSRRFIVSFLVLVSLRLMSFSLAQAQDSTPEPTAEMPSRGAPITEEAANTFVERFDMIFNGVENLDIANEIFAPDFVGHLPLAPELDVEGWKAYVGSFWAGAPDSTQEVNQIIVADDRLVIHVNYHGTHTETLFGVPGTGNPISMDGIGIFTFNEEGLATENWAVLDLGAVFAQIGAFPPAPEASADATEEAMPEMTPDMTMEAGMEATAEFKPAVEITEEMANAFLERYDAMFDEANVDIADEIFADDFVSHLSFGMDYDREGLKQFIASFYDGASDTTEAINQVIIASDRLVIHVTYTGTHDGTLFGVPATGNPISMDAIGIFSFNEDGLSIENWAVLDIAAVYAQIGAFPPVQ